MAQSTKNPAPALAYGEPDCGHCRYRTLPRSAGWGREGAKVLVVMSQPPDGFTSKALPGFFKVVLLELAGIDWRKVWFTFTTECRNPSGKPPSAVPIRCCQSRLLPELEWHNPELVLLMGKVAQQAVLPDYPVARYHGKKVAMGDRTYVPMLDIFEADDNPTVHEQLIVDFRYLPQQVPVTELSGAYTIGSKPLELGTGMVALDTETIGLYGKLLGTAFATKEGEAQYQPFEAGVATLNKAKAPWLLCHNAKYDLRILLDNGYRGHHRRVDDSILLAYCMNYDALGLKTLLTQELNFTSPDYGDVSEGGDLSDKNLDDVAKYCCKDTDGTLRLWNYLKANCSKDEWNLYETCDRPCMEGLVAMERKGIAIDLPYVREWIAKLKGEIAEAETDLFGSYDIDRETFDSPAKLGHWLHERGIELPFTEKTGQYKTGKRQLAQHMHADEVVVKILHIRQRRKLLTTYAENFLKYVWPDGRLHTQYNQTRVVTSRLSTSSFTQQNLPHAFEARRCFIAAPGNKLVRIDYSAIDMMVLAYMSGDEELMAVFERGEDIHNFMSDRLFGDHEPLHRYNTKSASYAIIYGGGPKTMYEQQSAPMGTYDASKWGAPPPLEWFKKLIADYFASFPGVRGYHERIQEFAKAHGYAEDYYKRRRYLPALNSPNRQLLARALRQVLNYPIAGTAAGIFKGAIVNAMPIDTPVLNVHDELVFEVPEDKLEQMVPQLEAAMRSVKAPMQLKAEAQIGTTLGEMM